MTPNEQHIAREAARRSRQLRTIRGAPMRDYTEEEWHAIADLHAAWRAVPPPPSPNPYSVR